MSKSIAFIGVGNMGCPMAENLMKAGKSVKVFDVSKKMLEIARDKNLEIIENLDDLITTDVETVITMLPEGKHSKEVYLADNGFHEAGISSSVKIISKLNGVLPWN